MAEDGSFAVPKLLPGTYTLHLWADVEERITEARGVRVGESGAEGVVLRWGE